MTHQTRHARIQLRTWTGRMDTGLTEWLGTEPHHVDGDQLILHGDDDDADVRLKPGWQLVRWPDGITSVASPRSAARLFEPVAVAWPGLVPDDSPVTDTDPVWTPPPPGDRREQLPDALLALIDVPPYTSTACEAATLLARQMPKHTHRRVELGEHSDRLHARCRRNNKFTGALCGCHCHA